MAKRKKKKGFGSLTKIKKPTPATSSLHPLVKEEEKPTFLDKLISQFRGGEKSFSVALHKFRNVYQESYIMCEALRRQSLSAQLLQRKREDYYPLISQFKTNLDTFLADYTSPEQAALVEAFMVPEMSEVVDLFRESYRSEEAIILTPSQIEHCVVYWVHYQIFKKYMIHPPEYTSFLWTELDSILFSQKDQDN